MVWGAIAGAAASAVFGKVLGGGKSGSGGGSGGDPYAGMAASTDNMGDTARTQFKASESVKPELYSGKGFDADSLYQQWGSKLRQFSGDE